ncbi:hypothetical protein 6939_0037 [Klebsiella phage 6939]|uniref:Uncharacterized protein n=1 Tax=Klebsiella phage 6939 TaxID=2912295 RepID=A0A9E7SB66_9CAUD|nr:hypothetical protein 6939_0037 [Klebsiella phage 6939]
MWQFIVIECILAIAVVQSICNLNNPPKVIVNTSGLRVTMLFVLMLLLSLQYSFFSSYPSTLGWVLFAFIALLYFAVFISCIITSQSVTKHSAGKVFINLTWAAVYAGYFMYYVY